MPSRFRNAAFCKTATHVTPHASSVSLSEAFQPMGSYAKRCASVLIMSSWLVSKRRKAAHLKMLRVWRFVRRCFTSSFLGAAFRVQNEKEKTEKSPPSFRKWVTDREKPAILSEMGQRERERRCPSTSRKVLDSSSVFCAVYCNRAIIRFFKYDCKELLTDCTSFCCLDSSIGLVGAIERHRDSGTQSSAKPQRM